MANKLVNEMVSLGDTDISLHIRILPESKLKILKLPRSA